MSTVNGVAETVLFLSTTVLKRDKIGSLGRADRAALVGGDKSLHLNGHEAGHAVGLILRDEAADGFGGDGAAAEEIVVFVEEVAAGVAGVGFPVVGGPPIAAVTIESGHRRRIGFAKVEIQAIDVRRNRFRFCGIDGDGDIGSLIRWCRRRGASLRRNLRFRRRCSLRRRRRNMWSR